MKVVLLHNDFDPRHLDQVVDQVRKLGAPTIRVYDLGFDDRVQAIEGCHRLRACEILGIAPDLIFLPSDTPIIGLGLDYDGGLVETIAELGDSDYYAIEI